GLLELRRIAPTVAVSPLPLVQVLEGLRAAGFSPAAEDTGGAVLDLTDRGRRINPRRRTASGLPPEPDPKQRAALAARLPGGTARCTGCRCTGSPASPWSTTEQPGRGSAWVVRGGGSGSPTHDRVLAGPCGEPVVHRVLHQRDQGLLGRLPVAGVAADDRDRR